MGPLDEGFGVHADLGAEGHRGAAVAHPDAIEALLHHPALLLRGKGGQLFLGDADGQGLALLGGQEVGLGKACQPAQFLGAAVLGAGDVDLHHFPAGEADACVFGLHVHLDGVRSHAQARKAQRKVGVGQPVAEGEQGLHPKAVKVAVAYIDPLLVDGLFQVAVQVAETLGAGIVGVAPGPGGSQLAFRRGLAQQYVCHGMAPFLAQLGQLQHRLDVHRHVQQIGQLHGAAGVEQQDDGQAQTVQGAQVVPLAVAEIVVAFFQAAVLALARDPAQDIDHGCRALHVLGHDGPALGQDKGVGRIGVKGIVHLFGRLQHLLFPGGAGRMIAGLVVLNPALACQAQPCVLQALVDGDVGAVVDVARADPALDRPAGAGAEQRHRGREIQGQGARVFQQDDAFCGGPAGQAAVFLLPQGRLLDEGAAVCACVCHNDLRLCSSAEKKPP